MPTLDNKTNWEGNVTQSTKSSTYTFNTKKTYVDKEIAFTVNAKDAVTKDPAGQNIFFSDTNTSGVAVTGHGITTAGWDTTTNDKTKYATKVFIDNGKTFQVDDDIYTWTINKDANGNVYLT